MINKVETEMKRESKTESYFFVKNKNDSIILKIFKIEKQHN